MPYSRQTSTTVLPPSTSFNTFTIWDSVNRDLRIVVLLASLSMAENSKNAWDYFKGYLQPSTVLKVMSVTIPSGVWSGQ